MPNGRYHSHADFQRDHAMLARFDLGFIQFAGRCGALLSMNYRGIARNFRARRGKWAPDLRVELVTTPTAGYSQAIPSTWIAGMISAPSRKAVTRDYAAGVQVDTPVGDLVWLLEQAWREMAAQTGEPTDPVAAPLSDPLSRVIERHDLDLLRFARAQAYDVNYGGVARVQFG